MNSVKTARYVALGACLVSFILCGLQVREHALHNPHPQSRRLVIRILWMVPLYSIESYIGLLWPNVYIYCDTVRDFYEALVIYTFFQLLANCLLEGERKIVEVLTDCNQTSHMFPFCCLRDWDMGDEFFYRTKIGILQYVPVKLFMSVLTYLLWGLDMYDDGSFAMDSGYVYIAFITNISQTWAIYCLVLFYLGSKHRLKQFNPIPKFLCIKLVVFATFWQSILIALLVKVGVIQDHGTWTSENIATGIQDFIICLEMIVASVGHWYAFPTKDFAALARQAGSVNSNSGRTLLMSRTLWQASQAADFSDVYSDVQKDIVDTMINKVALGTPLKYVPQIRNRYDNTRYSELNNQEMTSLGNSRKGKAEPPIQSILEEGPEVAETRSPTSEEQKVEPPPLTAPDGTRLPPLVPLRPGAVESALPRRQPDKQPLPDPFASDSSGGGPSVRESPMPRPVVDVKSKAEELADEYHQLDDGAMRTP